jgi:hypothetical protein
MPEENDSFYVYSGDDITTMLGALFTELFKQQDFETIRAICNDLEGIIIRARMLAGLNEPDNSGQKPH